MSERDDSRRRSGARGAGASRTEAPAAPVSNAVADRVAAVADPGPLGLAAFALTTFCLSVFNAGIIKTAALEAVVLPLALFYGGLSQLLAGMWEFRTGNTFGATAFSSYGAFWISFWALVTFFAADIPPEHAGDAIGLFLIAWGIFTTYMFFASLRTTAAVALVFLLLAITFFLLGIGESSESSGMVEVGGWAGILTAAAAWYASFAAVINSTFGRTVLPVMPLGD